jgi:hypothetical protein
MSIDNAIMEDKTNESDFKDTLGCQISRSVFSCFAELYDNFKGLNSSLLLSSKILTEF